MVVHSGTSDFSLRNFLPKSEISETLTSEQSFFNDGYFDAKYAASRVEKRPRGVSIGLAANLQNPLEMALSL